MVDEKNFEGWLGHSAEAADGKMVWGSFNPKVWTEDDVDMRVTHCGVCGTDIHVLRSAWGETRYREYFDQVHVNCYLSNNLNLSLLCWA